MTLRSADSGGVGCDVVGVGPAGPLTRGRSGRRERGLGARRGCRGRLTPRRMPLGGFGERVLGLDEVGDGSEPGEDEMEAARPGPVGGEAEGEASGPVDEPGGDGDELGAEGAGDGQGVSTVWVAEEGGPADQVVGEDCAASQAPLAEKCPEGTWESPAPSLRSRIASSTTAW